MAQKKNKENPYWIDRGVRQEKRVNDGAQSVEQSVIRAYRKAQSYLTKQASKLFNRAKNRSGLDEDEVKQLLNQTVGVDELVELRKLAADVENPDLQAAAKKRLNALAFKERITRAEDLKAKSFLVSKQIADVQLNKSTDFYIDVIHDSYNEATAETVIQQIEQAKSDSIINVWDGQKYDSKIERFKQAKQRNVPIEVWNDPKNRKVTHEFRELSTKYTQNILDSHWHGSNYSKRIWSDTEALAKRLEELFTVESMTGMSEFEMAKAIAAEFDRSIGVAQRLIRTEVNYMSNQAKLKGWRDRGVKEYRLIAVLDFRTSKICQGKDGKIYLVSEAVVNGSLGTYPPFHPWCRTIAVAFIGKRSLNGKRTANDPLSGKTMTIEQRDTYDDWMKKLKEKYSDDEIESQKKKIINRKKDTADLKRLKDILGEDYSPKSLEEYQETKYNDDEGWVELKRTYRDVKWMKEAFKNYSAITDSHGIPFENNPKSVCDWYRDGELYRRRFYGKNGKPRLDIDFTNHKQPDVHQIVPHTHDWNYYWRNKKEIPDHRPGRKPTLGEQIVNEWRSNDESKRSD
ncbi:minor capsid protein [Enterococcus hulanensis]|nr:MULTISPECIES: minor capsid protein [Enterococcus]MBO0413216.1 minor capsid protein [Enterococcus hulanensis]OTO15117.1 hypothetical protein A5875_004274 [Enterococcus sp. 3H8_DIV0648]